MPLWHSPRAFSMQLSQGPAAEHWTAVVGRPSLVKSGALPPHPPRTAALSAAAATERANAPERN